jgi:hypothetical protein
MHGMFSTRFCLVFTAVILLVGAYLLASRHPVCWGIPNVPVPQTKLASRPKPNLPVPTLAPPQNVVLLRAEADNAELEIGWAGL